MTHECVSDEAVAADVEKYGLSVMLVSEDDECPKFGYSIGLYRNFNHPEIIVFGLCLKDVVERDPSVNDLADLPLGWRAWRENVSAEWRRDARISEEQS